MIGILQCADNHKYTVFISRQEKVNLLREASIKLYQIKVYCS